MPRAEFPGLTAALLTECACKLLAGSVCKTEGEAVQMVTRVWNVANRQLDMEGSDDALARLHRLGFGNFQSLKLKGIQELGLLRNTPSKGGGIMTSVQGVRKALKRWGKALLAAVQLLPPGEGGLTKAEREKLAGFVATLGSVDEVSREVYLSLVRFQQADGRIAPGDVSGESVRKLLSMGETSYERRRSVIIPGLHETKA